MSAHELVGIIGALTMGGCVLLAVLIFVDNFRADRKRKRDEAPLVDKIKADRKRKRDEAREASRPRFADSKKKVR